MRKLRVVLVLLCAMLVSVGLFACKKKPKPVDPDTDTNITNVMGVENIPTITDSDDEAAFKQKINGITVSYRAGSTRGTVSGSACTITGEVTYQKVGTYSLTVTPNENNPQGRSYTFNVKIVHDFGEEDANGVATCRHDGARRVASDEDVILHYGNFHQGTLATLPTGVYEETKVVTYGEGKEATSNVKPFGTVEAFFNGRTEAHTVPTLTVGDLEPGTTITVRGTAQTSWENWKIAENAYYYFPVIGFADPYMNNAEFDGTTHRAYIGGTSVFVRGEGWVLYNGVGDTTSGPRMLASLSGGQSESINYGSWKDAFASDTNPVPSGYVNGEMPDPASAAWHNWWVYSAGTAQLNSGDYYQDETDLELVWTYREDGIIELQYNYNYKSTTNAVSLVAYIKVPTSTRGFYRTMLHGDYVDMTIKEYEKIETLTPSEFRFNADSTGTIVAYEGAMLDASALKTEFKYVQTGEAWQPYTVVLDNVYATTDETVTEGTEWVSLGKNALSTKYNNYKIEFTKAGKTFSAAVPKANIKVVPNAISEAFGADVKIDAITFGNNRKVGAFALGVNAEGTAITLALQGAANYAQALDADQKAKFTNLAANTEYRYVALRLTNNGLKDFANTQVAVKSGTADVPYLLNIQDKDAYLVLALTEDTAKAGVTIEGLNGTPVNVTFANLNGFKVTSVVDGANSGKLNQGATLTFTFTAVAGSKVTSLMLGTTLVPVEGLKGYLAENAGGFEIDGKVVTALTENGQSVTVSVKFPAANISKYAAYNVGASVDGIRADIVEEIHYDFDFADNVKDDKGAVLADGMYAYVENGKLIIAGALPADQDITTLVGQDAAEFNVNINAGDKENIRLLDLSFAYSAEEEGLVFTDAANLPAGVAIRSNVVAGVGTLIYFEIDAAKLGFTGAYAFEPFYGNGNTYYTVNNGEVKAVEVTDKGDKKIIVDGDCFDAGIVANEIKKENEVIFYLNPASVGGAHKDADNDNVCDLCGAAISSLDFSKPGWFVSSWQDADKVYLTNGMYYEFTGVYEKASGETKGMTVLLDGYDSNNKWYEGYRVAGDGYGHHVLNDGNGAWGTITDPYFDNDEFRNGKSNFTNSNMTTEHPYNTIQGVLDPDGNAITASSLLAAMIGGTFRYTVSRQNDVIDIRVRLYKEGVEIDGTPFYDYTFKVVCEEGKNYKPVFTFFDNLCSVKGGKVNMYKGTFVNSVLSGAEAKEITIDETTYHSSNLTFGKVTVDGDYAKLAVSGMAQKAANGSYTHYAAFTLNFSQALVESTTVTISGVTDAKAVLANGNKAINVYVPLSASANLATATISIVNQEASTMQCDVQIDLSGIVVSDITATPNTDNLYINGGSFTVAYAGGDISGASISVNGGTAVAVSDLSATETNLGDVTATISGSTITFTVKAVDFKSVLKTYTVKLTQGTATLAETTVYSTAIKAADQLTQNVFVSANGAELTFVFTNAAASTQDFYLNANNGYAMTDKTLLDSYKLNFTLSADGKISFATRNILTTATTAVYTKIGNNNVVALTVNLAGLGIAADTAYGFEAKIGRGTVEYRTVSAARAITAMSINAEAEAAVVLAATCKVEGVKAKAVGEGNDATFYYGFERTFAEHAFESGVCSACGAVQIAGNITAENHTIAADKLADVAENGLTVSFLLSAGVAGDWATKAIAVHGHNAIITSANLSLTNTGVGALDTSKLDGDIKTKAEALAKVNGGAAYPNYNDGTWGTAWTEDNVFNGYNPWAADQKFEASTPEKTVYNYATVSVSKTGGIQYYLRGILMFDYQGTRFAKPFAELFLLMAEEYGIDIASLGISAANATVLPYSIGTYAAKAMYDSYVTEAGKHHHVYDPETDRCTADGCPVAGGALNPDHKHNFVDHLCRCGERNAPVYSENQAPTTENPITIGKADFSNGYSGDTNPTWTGELKKGEVVTMTGTMTSKADGNWKTVCAYLFSGLAPNGAFRIDWCVNGTTNDVAENPYTTGAYTEKEKFTIMKTIGPDWGTFLATIADCNITIVFDWTDSSRILVRYIVVGKNNNVTQNMLYTVASATNFDGRDFYSIGLGSEESQTIITNIGRATKNPPAQSENQTNPVIGAEDFSLGFTGYNPVWIGPAVQEGEKLTITGALTSAGAGDYEVPLAYLTSSEFCMSFFRTDGYLESRANAAGWNGAVTPAVENADTNYNTANGGAGNKADTAFMNLIKDCTFTLVYDWTVEGKIVITATFTKDETTRTTTFTLTPAFESFSADKYYVGLGGEHICLKVSSIVKAPAATTPDA